jgi:TRAP-type C4-dicarboxylate transport system permease large subunit
MPIIYGLGMSGVWFGILLVVTIEAAMITPPIGLNLYVLQGVEPEYKITTIAVGAAPFLMPMMVTMGLVIAFPQIALWLPSILA